MIPTAPRAGVGNIAIAKMGEFLNGYGVQKETCMSFGEGQIITAGDQLTATCGLSAPDILKYDPEDPWGSFSRGFEEFKTRIEKTLAELRDLNTTLASLPKDEKPATPPVPPPPAKKPVDLRKVLC